MTAFVNSILLWGLVALAVPVLIHLINLLRHRRVDWAAMEFLLQSQKKNSTWIRLKELLLLLLRLGAVAAVVLVLAQPLLRNEFGRRFGGTRTHHVVLLDDSYSMSDRWGETTAFDLARGVAERIGQNAANEPTEQVYSLLRFSRMSAGAAEPDLLEESVNVAFPEKLASVLRGLTPSQLAVGPEQPLDTLVRLLGAAEAEHRVVYLVSDYRAKDWEEPEELKTALSALNESEVEVQLINCVESTRPNLAITSLEPRRGIRAAGVPLEMEVTVRNYGSDTVRDVSLQLAEDGQPRPAVVIDRIDAGQSETRRFPVYFPLAGDHVVSAALQSDTIDADNVRFSLVDVPLTVPVLLVDGDRDFFHARFLAVALDPGGSVKTGIEARIEPPSFLNTQPLDRFQAVFVLNVERLDQVAIDALEAYARQGRGVAFFTGELTRSTFFNERLHRDGQGLFPVPLAAETQLIVDRLEKAADLKVSDHPIFRVFAGERNTFLNSVIVDRYFSVAKTWDAAGDPDVRILARLRNNAPLVVEKPFGEGRVVTVLTTAGPRWNNWGPNPSFVVAMLELEAYLAALPAVADTQRVGTPITVRLDPARYEPHLRLLPPGAGASGAILVDAVAAPAGLEALFPASETSTAGVYQLQLLTHEGQVETRTHALNVDPREGDLTALGGEDLSTRLKGVKYQYRLARDFHAVPREVAGSNVSTWLLYMLVVLLVGEQALAYSCSYHPTAKEVGR